MHDTLENVWEFSYPCEKGKYDKQLVKDITEITVDDLLFRAW